MSELRIAPIGSPSLSDESAENRPVRGSFVPDAITTATRPSMTHGEAQSLYTTYNIRRFTDFVNAPMSFCVNDSIRR